MLDSTMTFPGDLEATDKETERMFSVFIHLTILLASS